MLPEEKFGSLEMPGEINPIAEEEDTSDAPTVIQPREYRKPDLEEDFFWWPF
jgi:fumarate hydratase class II